MADTYNEDVMAELQTHHTKLSRAIVAASELHRLGVDLLPAAKSDRVNTVKEALTETDCEMCSNLSASYSGNSKPVPRPELLPVSEL